MEQIARTTKQVGATIRRHRRLNKLTQGRLGARMGARQATVSKLEAGEPATQLRVVMDALSALNLELVIRPRSATSTPDVEDLF